MFQAVVYELYSLREKLKQEHAAQQDLSKSSVLPSETFLWLAIELLQSLRPTSQ